MEHFQLLAFLAVCVAAARTNPEPISTPFIPCKALPPLKALNLQQLTGRWVTKKLYALSEQAAAIGEKTAKPGQRCTQQEIIGANGLTLQMAVTDKQSNTRNLSTCNVNRHEHGLWTCSPVGQGPFDVVVIMAEPSNFMLLASACAPAKNIPGLERFGSDRYAVVLWLFQKKDSPPLSPEKINQIDQKAQQVLQRQPIQRQIECGKGEYYGGASHLNNQEDFDGPPNQGQGGFVNSNDKNNHKHRPGGVQIPPVNGNNPHFGSQGGSTVLKPGVNPQPGVTYYKPGTTGALQGGQYHSNPEVNKVLQGIHNWFSDPRNKKRRGQGQHGSGGNTGNQGGGFGNNGDFGGNGYENENGGFGNQELGFRLGAGKNQTTGAPDEATEANGQTEDVTPENTNQ